MQEKKQNSLEIQKFTLPETTEFSQESIQDICFVSTREQNLEIDVPLASIATEDYDSYLSVHGKNSRGLFAARTDIGDVNGSNSRIKNEDACFLLDGSNLSITEQSNGPALFLAAFDAVKGDPYSINLEKEIVAELSKSLLTGSTLEKCLDQAVLNTVNEIKKRDNSVDALSPEVQDAEKSQSVCMAAACIEGDTIQFLHRGDVRGSIIRDGKIIFSTKDEVGVFGAINNLVGFHQLELNAHMRNTISPKMKLQSGDIVLLASDGLSKFVNEEGVERLVHNQMEPREIVQNLRQSIRETVIEQGLYRRADNIVLVAQRID